MSFVGSYLISITCAAVICGGILALTGKNGTSSTIIRLLTGLFMAYTIISPVTDIKLSNFEYITKDIFLNAEEAVSNGIMIAYREESEYIKQTFEAYILDKASSLNADLDVEVFYDHEGKSVDEIRIRGNISPFARNTLKTYITEELGIPQEDQNWLD